MEDHEIQAEPSEWTPILNPGDIAIVGKCAEEAGELTSALARCLIQGLDGLEPTTHKPNKTWLEDEIADVIAMCRILKTRFNLDTDRMNKRVMAKEHYKRRWLEMLDGE